MRHPALPRGASSSRFGDGPVTAVFRAELRPFALKFQRVADFADVAVADLVRGAVLEAPGAEWIVIAVAAVVGL